MVINKWVIHKLCIKKKWKTKTLSILSACERKQFRCLTLTTRQSVQFQRMTRSQSHTPPHLSNCLLFSTQKNHMEWEMAMEGQPFCSGGESLPILLFWNCFYYTVLGFQSLNFSYDIRWGGGKLQCPNSAKVRYWKTPTEVGIFDSWQTHSTNVMQHGKGWCVSWICGCLWRELDQWDGWK